MHIFSTDRMRKYIHTLVLLEFKSAILVLGKRLLLAGEAAIAGTSRTMLEKYWHTCSHCLPCSPSFETLDAFAVCRNSFCAPSPTKNRLRILGFQMTVNKRGHDLKLRGARAVRTRMVALFEGEFKNVADMSVVFVTIDSEAVAELDVWKRRQQWKTQEGKPTNSMDAVRQFVLVLPNR